MKLKHYILVGIAQGIAALPGVSRSGMSISTMLFMGMEPGDAFRLSYLAYIPASLGVRPPFFRLQPLQAATQFSNVVFPPRDLGMM